MRRLLPLLAVALVAVAPLLPAAPASACAPPEEPSGPATCCQRTLVSVTVGDHTVSVPDPRIRLDCA